nr:hypothetical protein [Mycolicibacterium pulveris]
MVSTGGARQVADGRAHRLGHRRSASGDAQRRALQDRPLEQTFCTVADHQVRDRVRTRGPAEHRDRIRVTTKSVDVVANPPQRGQQVEQSEVGRHISTIAEEAEHSESISDRHDDHALLGHQSTWVVLGEVTGTRDITTAVDPDQHR